MEKPTGKLTQWYKDRNIFITGGTGFMGKVLIEKLLYNVEGIGDLYILMRPKRGRTAEQRIDDIWKTPCFARIRDKFPHLKSKIIPIHGDLVTENLGISESEMQELIENVSVVFHCGATLKLEATLRDAIEQNTAGTQRVVDVVKKFKKLDVFIHMSTAFCSADLDVFEERVYPTEDDPRHVIEITRYLKDEILIPITKKLIEPHPNTYTYSKRLAEVLVANDAENINVAIVRPSIVTPCGVEPVPGWVDTLNGPMGLIAASGKGVLRSMHCKGEFNAHTIPCDIAINAMIVIAYKTGTEQKRDQVPVYNLTNDGVFHITWGEILRFGKQVYYKYPFEQMIWYPDGDMRSSYFVHWLYCIFTHWLPAYLIDMLMFVLRQKRFMVRIQHKIHDGLELLQFFTTRNWQFSSERFLSIHDGLNDEEKKIFHTNFNIMSVEEYLTQCILGTRQYCMKEDLKSLPRCRVQQTFMYMLDRGLKLAFCIYIFSTIMNHSEDIIEIIHNVLMYFTNLLSF